MIDVRSYLLRAEVAGEDALAALRRAGLVGDLVAIDVDCAIRASGGVKAAEVAAVIAGDGVTAPPHRAVRVELFGVDDAGRFSPLEAGRGARTPVSTEPRRSRASPLRRRDPPLKVSRAGLSVRRGSPHRAREACRSRNPAPARAGPAPERQPYCCGLRRGGCARAQAPPEVPAPEAHPRRSRARPLRTAR